MLSLSAAAFADKILEWYQNNRRILPWREDPTPYHVWLSEIMLQQTQVQTVLPYYERFLAALPTVDALADADLDTLHKLWEGLGYYSRVDNLQKAAKILQASFDSNLPETYAELLSLPGIGPYTAGAIASIAYGQRVCAVDGNVLRILSRVTAYDGPVNVASAAKPLQELAQQLVPADRPGDFNQALMDLGAMICRPNGAPDCAHCPLGDACQARAKNLTGLLPIKKPKKPRTIEDHTIIILVCGQAVWIHKRPKKQLLAGLWEFIDIPQALDEAGATNLLKKFHAIPTETINLGAARHIFTHKEWHMQGWLFELDAPCSMEDGQWVDAEALHSTYAMAGAISYYRSRLFEYLL